MLTLSVIFQTLARAPLLNLQPPVADLIQRLSRALLGQQIQHLLQYLPGIADDRHISRHRF